MSWLTNVSVDSYSVFSIISFVCYNLHTVPDFVCLNIIISLH